MFSVLYRNTRTHVHSHNNNKKLSIFLSNAERACASASFVHRGKPMNFASSGCCCWAALRLTRSCFFILIIILFFKCNCNGWNSKQHYSLFLFFFHLAFCAAVHSSVFFFSRFLQAALELVGAFSALLELFLRYTFFFFCVLYFASKGGALVEAFPQGVLSPFFFQLLLFSLPPSLLLLLCARGAHISTSYANPCPFFFFLFFSSQQTCLLYTHFAYWFTFPSDHLCFIFQAAAG